ncbi:MAG: serine hydroxymethyltransferase, partial [Desulfobacterales bacterium]|nr:serine hydroxymethyltransferase [Desulfobacterales bacterium]
SSLEKTDPDIAQLIDSEKVRLEETLNLIAAENHIPAAILETLGSVLSTKTIEGYPGKRFHAGCIHVDEVEKLAIERCRALFRAEHVNVQPHSGTAANLAVYFSVLDIGDRILAMNLAHGGHLSHGHKASITGRCFDFRHYGVDPVTELIDYDQVSRMATEFRPKMIVAGASSYPRCIDYARMAEIARCISAYLLVDMAHLAGLVAAGVIPSPVPFSDFVTFTGYKTLMGPRGGVILCRAPYAQKIDRTIFPGCQGTSAVNLIAAKAMIFKLAGEKAFRDIQAQTVANAVCLAAALADRGYRIVTGGTDNHLVLVDMEAKNIDGGTAEKILEAVGLIANRNVIPGDEQKPGKVSGVRFGTAAVTTRGMGESEIREIAQMIDRALAGHQSPGILEKVKTQVASLCGRFQVYA